MPKGRVSPVANSVALATLAPSADGLSTLMRPCPDSAMKMSPFGATRITRGPSTSRVKTSILNPGGSFNEASPGFATTAGKSRAEGVANGAGSPATLMRCVRPGASSCQRDCAPASPGENASVTSSTDKAVEDDNEQRFMALPSSIARRSPILHGQLARDSTAWRRTVMGNALREREQDEQVQQRRARQPAEHGDRHRRLDLVPRAPEAERERR